MTEAILGLDVGEAWVKRSRLRDARAVAVVDPAWGALRTPRSAARWSAGEAVLLTASADQLAAVRQELEGEGVQVRGTLDPLVAIAIAAREESPATAEREAVLDLGQRDVRVGWVRWRRVGTRDFPVLEAHEVASPLAGARLDDDLAYALQHPVEAARELKELCSRTRGPWVRECGGQVYELDARQGQTLLGEFVESWRVALPTLVALVRERACERIVIAGGMAGIGPVLQPLLAALAGLGLPTVVAERPGFAAARGAAYAGAGAAAPQAPAVRAWELRHGSLAPRELVPAGAALPARFGPFPLRRTQALSPLLLELGDELRALELPAGTEQVSLAWSFEAGWTALADQVPLATRPASEAEARAREAALGFDWASSGQAVALDALVVFRATRGGGTSHALLEAALPALLAPLGAARLRAIAVGDHPQAHLRPRFVTELQPAWGDAAALQAFVAQVLEDPVDGIDLPDAFEVALQQASELDWRPQAARAVLVFSDVPSHVPEQPPYTQIRWQDPAQRLRDAGAELVGVHLQGGGRPPSVVKSARAFLEELDPQHHALTGEPPAELLERLASLASRRAPDRQGQALIDALGGWSFLG
ncbi:MAG: hypothetical protein R3F62_08310 [Planctomycetota bacterium]